MKGLLCWPDFLPKVQASGSMSPRVFLKRLNAQKQQNNLRVSVLLFLPDRSKDRR